MADCSSCGQASSCSSAGSAGACPSQMMAEQDKRIADTLARVGRKLFVMSGKGGVGKSSVAVNLACALALMGRRVGVLDVDIHGPSVPNLLGMGDSPLMVNEEGLIVPAEGPGGLKVISMDMLLGSDRDQAVIWRGPKKTGAIRQFVSDVAWGDLDFLVIDSPPGTGDEHMTVMQTVPDAECLVVTTPQEISLADVRKCLNFVKLAKARMLGLVENMSGLVCPHCGRTVDLFGRGGGRALAERDGVTFLGAVPLDPAAVVSADRGLPAVLAEGPGAAKDAFMELARVCAATMAKEAGE